MTICYTEDNKITIVIGQDGITIIDFAGAADVPCECGEEAMFFLDVYGREVSLCEKCLATLGKRIIDALR